MDNQVRFHLDNPVNNEHGYHRFYFSGWVLPSGKVRTFELVLNDNQRIGIRVRHVKRPDLAAAFPKTAGAIEGGFEGIAEVGSAEGTYDLAVYGVTDDREHVLIGKKRLVNERAAILAPPRNFSLGLTNQCNLSCIMCPAHSPHSKFRVVNATMKGTMVEKILSELPRFSPSLQRVGLQDYGEPFLYNGLFDVISQIEKNMPGCTIVLTSNGTILDDRLIEKILGIKKGIVTFSLDAGTSGTYEKIRAGGNFPRVLENIRKLVSGRKKMQNQSPVIAANFVITPRNMQEMPHYVDLCETLGVDHIGFVHPFGLFESDKEDLILPLDEKENTCSRLFQDIKNRIAASEAALAGKCTIPGLVPDGFLTDCSFNGKSTMVIDTDGDVFPCCVLAAKAREQGSFVTAMGNAGNQSLHDIWNSREFIQFRENFFKGQIPHPLCGRCPKYYGI